LKIAVVDYGMGNIRSVSKALEHVAPRAEVLVTSDPAAIRASDRVVVPGQGAMPDCMRQLAASGARDAVVAHNGDVFSAQQWLLAQGARKAGRYYQTTRRPIRDPLLASIDRKAKAATYAAACVSLGMEGVVLDDLKRLGGVA